MAGGYVATKAQDSGLPPPTKSSWLLIWLTIMAVMGGFLFGYDTGIVSGAMILIRKQFHLTDLWQELIVSVTVGAAAVGALAAQFFNEYFGRKWTILGSSALFIVGAAILAGSPTKEVLLVGRVVLGLAIGVSSSTIPAYVAECSPAHVRGRMTTMFQLMITFGFWIAGLIAGGLSYVYDQNASWRAMLGLAIVPAMIQLVGFFFMPESPRWLATHGREEEAFDVLKRINGKQDPHQVARAQHEMNVIRADEEETQREKERMGYGNQPSILIMFKTPHLVKALVIGCSLQMFQQLSGINTVMYYSASIIMMSGVSNENLAIWLAAVTSGVNFFCTFIGVYLVEKIGRRLLLLCSIIGVMLCLIILGIAFAVIATKSPQTAHIDGVNVDGVYYGFDENGTLYKDNCLNLKCDDCSYKVECGWCYDSNSNGDGTCVSHSTVDLPPTSTMDNTGSSAYGRCFKNYSGDASHLNSTSVTWDYGFCPTSLSWLPILGMVLYLCCFSAGYGPMPWVICAEIFPNWARGTGTSLSTTFNWLFNLLISLTFLTLARAITRQGAYFLYAGITFLGLVWCYLVIPETKNKEIEQIEQLLKGPWFTCGREPPQSAVPSRHGSTRYGGTAESETALDNGGSNKYKEQSPLDFRQATTPTNTRHPYANRGFEMGESNKTGKF